MWPLDQPDDYDGQEHMETGFHTGFGYDPMSNEYKVVTFTTYFQEMSFKGMCYWLGIEQDKELFPFDVVGHRFHANGRLIISFDTSREVFHGIPLPSELQQFVRSNHLYLKLTVWNESVAFFAISVDDRRYPEPYEMWVMDDDFKGAWTKYLTIEGTDDQIQDDENIFVYVNSIVSVMGRSHKLKSIENTCSDKDEDAMVMVVGKRESCQRLYSYFGLGHSTG
nr:uncharacterized protein LOC114821312 [Malus domestica]